MWGPGKGIVRIPISDILNPNPAGAGVGLRNAFSSWVAMAHALLKSWNISIPVAQDLERGKRDTTS